MSRVPADDSKFALGLLALGVCQALDNSAAATRREERKLSGCTVGSFLAPVLIVAARLYFR
jgi:hypothetical protein